MDLIIIGAEVRDPSHAMPLGDAVGISAGRFTGLGAARDLLARRERGTRVIRLRGGTLLPGFVDAHLHFRGFVRRFDSLDCSAAAGPDSLLHLIRGAAARGTGWMFAHGLEHRRSGFGALPSAEALSRAARGRPL